MKCEYCQKQNKAGVTYCEFCGAELRERKADMWKSEPFFYNGYICYTLLDHLTDSREVQFWLGQELIERIVVPAAVLEKRVKECESVMPFFWELFQLARGEKEVLEFQELNEKYPATFEVRRIENPEKLRWQEMNLMELVREARR